jgi:hypothetical protein
VCTIKLANFVGAALGVAIPAALAATTVDLSDTAPAPRAAIAGSWYVTTSQGYSFHYVLVAEPNPTRQTTDGDAFVVKGQIVNRDGKTELNGGLQGLVPAGSRTLTYSFSQNDGGQGTGKLTLSPTGKSLEGVARIGRQRYTIDGTRIQ